MTDYSFNAYTPLYHEALDGSGLAAGTRVWSADGSFRPVETLAEGDLVFGVTFTVEEDYLPIHPTDRMKNLVKVWRPRLVARRVLGVSRRPARAWQLTFGGEDQAYESRRLVCGADTRVHAFPLDHEAGDGARVVDLATVLDNPRTPPRYRAARVIDHERTVASGEAVWVPTPYTDTRAGDLVTVIPYSAYGGQTGLMRTDIRPYERYVYAGARECVPVMERTDLYELELQPDTRPEAGLLPGQTRTNLIAQTPFAEEARTRRMRTDPNAGRLDKITDPEEFAKAWDAYAEQRAQSAGPSVEREVTTNMQGQFYETSRPEIAKAIGIEGGFLDGGILITL